MKDRIYIDTSIIGGCFDEEFELWSNQLMKEFENGETNIIISAIVAAEFIYIAEKKNAVPDGFKSLTDLLETKNAFFYPLDYEIILKLKEVPLLEIHDRIIVATALANNCSLVTKDKRIKELKIVETIWE